MLFYNREFVTNSLLFIYVFTNKTYINDHSDFFTYINFHKMSN